jgi:YesN/AraC family two-component response regulator
MFKLLIAADNLEGCKILNNLVNENFGNLFHVSNIVDEKNLMDEVFLQHPDFIFFDIDRPGLNVLKVAAQIKAYLPECRLIVISTFSDFNYTRAALSIGADEYIDKPASIEKIKAGIYRAIINLHIHPASKKLNSEVNFGNYQARTSRAKALLGLAIDYLERNYQQDISLEATAERIQISSFYLSKLFKQSVGENFIDYLTAIRIRKAKEFLANPHYTIKDVCYQVGYKDPNYFARVFKKTCGITPTEYQTKHICIGIEMGNCV